MLVKMAWRNLWRNKRRTLITMASIFFAVILAVMMKSLKEGVYDNIIDNFAGSYLGYARIHSDGFWDDQSLDKSIETGSNLSFLESFQNINYAPRIESFTLCSFEDRTKGGMLVGVDPIKDDEVFGLASKLEAGEYFSENEQSILVGKKLAEDLGVGIGDSLVMIGQGYRGANAVGIYPVKGLLNMGSPDLNKLIIYLPLNEAQYFYNMFGLITAISIKPDNPEKTFKIVDKLKSKAGDSFEVLSWQELAPDIDQLIKGDRAEGTILMGILYIIISFGIFGTVLMMLAERRHEFGILVSLGMKRSKLAITVFIEIITIAFLGSLAGLIGAFPVVFYFNQNPIAFGESNEMKKMYEEYGLEAVLQPSLDPSIFLDQTIIVCLFASIIALYPFRQILKLNSLEAMRS